MTPTSTINRRQWLKNSTRLTGSLAFLSSGLTGLVAAAPHKEYVSKTFTIDEEELLLQAPSVLKARLSSNENPFGPSDKAKEAISEAINNSYQYPRVFVRQLAEKIADYEKVTEEHVALGAGSSPLLLAASIFFGKEGGKIISGDPTYASLPRDAQEYFNADWLKIPLTPDYKLDLDAMEKAVDDKTVMMYLCNPNNPTGTIADTGKLKAFCERVSKRIPVFIDEAYIDYLDKPDEASMMDCVRRGYNVMVARTFSKLYGFAGLRVGYMVAQPDMLAALKPFTRGGNSISATSVNAALASYQDTEFLQYALKKTSESKKFLYEVLKKQGYEYIPSSTNFVMFPIKMEGKLFTEKMLEQGVSVRFWKFNDKDWCRVSIGTLDEMKAFAEAFTQIS